MTPDEVFCEWLRRRGHHVFRTASSYWFDQGPRVLQAFPLHWIIEPPDGEIEALLRENKMIAARYSTPLSAPFGALSYHIVHEGPSYELSMLTRQLNQDIRKGNAFASMERIPLARLAEEGWTLRQMTLERQGRQRAENREWWRRLCLSAEDLPGFEAWGALHDGRLEAAILAFEYGDCYTFLYSQSDIHHLRHGINNALLYRILHEVVQRPEITYKFIGLHSLDAPPSLDRFKFRMRLTPRPVRQRVVFHPSLAPLVTGFSHQMLRGIVRLLPGLPALAKAEGFVRFYRQGLLPLDRQPVPEPLKGMALLGGEQGE